MKIDARLLLGALDDRRAALARLAGRDQPLNWVEVAAATGTYPALYTRLKNGLVPGPENLNKLMTWLNRDAAEFELCTACPEDLAADPDNDPDDPDDVDDMPEEESPADDDGEDGSPRQTAAIVATSGYFDDSEDPETQAAVTRARELMAEGAVGVSIGADMDPDHMPDKDLLDELIAAEKWEEAEALLADIPLRLRHLAIVDTAAFSDARPTLDPETGNISGPITFEGIWTGDMRYFPLNSFTWETTLPIPIIWDRQDGDHTGVKVGTITGVERVLGEVSQPDDAVAASMGAAGVDVIPAAYIRKPKPGPLTVTPPDENGIRRIYGLAAAAGVCHPNPKYSQQCFTYPGDADPQLRRFHVGMPRMLSDGTTVRLGAMTMFGLHASAESMSRPGVTSAELAKYEDGREIFAAVRAWDDPAGLLVSGIVMPDITDAQLHRAMSMGSSVEMSPSRLGRNVVGMHLVPTQAWPVAASGAAMTGPEPMVLAEENDDELGDELADELEEQLADEPGSEPQVAVTFADGGSGEEFAAKLDAIEAKLDQMSTALALVAGSVLDFPEPPEPEPVAGSESD